MERITVSSPDLKRYMSVREEALSGNGSFGTQAVFNVLDSLAFRFGNEFTVAGTNDALDQIIEAATLAKQELNNK